MSFACFMGNRTVKNMNLRYTAGYCRSVQAQKRACDLEAERGRVKKASSRVNPKPGILPTISYHITVGWFRARIERSQPSKAPAMAWLVNRNRKTNPSACNGSTSGVYRLSHGSSSGGCQRRVRWKSSEACWVAGAERSHEAAWSYWRQNQAKLRWIYLYSIL